MNDESMKQKQKYDGIMSSVNNIVKKHLENAKPLDKNNLPPSEIYSEIDYNEQSNFIDWELPNND
jgi:hypothetical protein